MNIGEKLLNIVTSIGDRLKHHHERIVALEENGGNIAVDAELSDTSENPVQNKVITATFNQAAQDVNTAIGGLGSAIQSLSTGLDNKQDKLVSGTNIKTINGQSVLGSGNITIEGGGGGSITVDAAFSTTSENPVQNKVITAAMNEATENVSAVFEEFSDAIQNGIMPNLPPAVTAADNGKVLAVENGVWTAVAIPSAEEASF